MNHGLVDQVTNPEDYFADLWPNEQFKLQTPKSDLSSRLFKDAGGEGVVGFEDHDFESDIVKACLEQSVHLKYSI